MRVHLYVEGGGDSKALTTACRKGFQRFIAKAGVTGRMPRVVACGGRQRAYSRFWAGHGSPDIRPMLLVDAKGPVSSDDPWEHLRISEGWDRPPGANDDQCHLMVEVMETWFLGDKQALASFFGHGFRENALPGNQWIERVSKADLLAALKQATRRTKKGKYAKGSHSFEILALLDPRPLEASAPHARRFLDALREGSPA